MKGSAFVLGVLMAAAAGAPFSAVADGPKWRAPTVLQTAAAPAYPPAVAVEDDGGALVVWARGGADGAIWSSSRSTADAPFSAPRRLSDPCSGCLLYGLRLAMNGRGDAVVAWLQSAAAPMTTSTVHATSRVADGAFAADAALSDARTLPQGDPGVAMSDTGRALVAFDGADRLMRIRSASTPGTWTVPVVLGGEPIVGGGRPSVAAGAAGHIAVAWSTIGCTGVIVRAAPGDAWGAPASIAGAECAEAPVVSIDPTGGVDAAWVGWDGYGRRLKVAAAPAAGSFGPHTDLGASGSGINPPISLRRLAGGDLVAAWADATYAGSRPNTSRRTAGTWGPTRTATAGDGAAFVEVAIGAGGTVATGNYPGPGGTPTAVVTGPDGTWGPRRPAMPPASGLPRVAVYPSGEVIAAAAGTTTVSVAEYTARPLAALTIPDPAPVRLAGPARVALGARATLTLRLSGAAYALPVEVQRRSGSRWTRIARTSVTSDGYAVGASDILIPVRFAHLGVQRYRVLVGTGRVASGRVTVRVTRPARRRIPLAGRPVAIASGAAGVWVIGAPDAVGARAVARLEPRSGSVAATVPVGSTPWSTLAVGRSAVWVPRPDGVLRVDARTGTPRLAPLAGGARMVAANTGYVWAAGVCDPSPVPLGTCQRRRAVALDPATGATTGTQVSLAPAGSADVATLIGRTLWLHGEAGGDSDDSVLARADAATGALSFGPNVYAGRFGVPFAPLDATHVWIVRGVAVTEGLPRSRPLPVLLPRFRAVQTVRTGTRVWLLEQRPGTAGQLRQERLVEIAIGPGRRTGRVVNLGTTLDRLTTFTIAGGIAWVLRPGEAAVLRVPLP